MAKRPVKRPRLSEKAKSSTCSVTLTDIAKNMPTRLTSLEHKCSLLKAEVDRISTNSSQQPTLTINGLMSILQDPFNTAISTTDISMASNFITTICSEIMARITARKQLIAFNIPDAMTLDQISSTISTTTKIPISRVKRLYKCSKKYTCPVLVDFYTEQHALIVLKHQQSLRSQSSMKLHTLRHSLTPLERSYRKRTQLTPSYHHSFASPQKQSIPKLFPPEDNLANHQTYPKMLQPPKISSLVSLILINLLHHWTL